LCAVTVFESYNVHAMAAEALAPSVYAVFFGDATADDEFVVAAHANVVVASVTLEAVIACV